MNLLDALIVAKDVAIKHKTVMQVVENTSSTTPEKPYEIIPAELIDKDYKNYKTVALFNWFGVDIVPKIRAAQREETIK